MQVTLECIRPTRVEPSPRVLEVAAMFGLGIDEQKEATIIPRVTLDLNPGEITFITGASGSGKSTLIRLIEDAATEARVIRFDRLPEPPDRPLVDCFEQGELPDVLRWLSVAGLGDAFVMLRRPAELSDGQRYRFQLARTLARVEGAPSDGQPVIVLADEFGASLDRTTAHVIARNVRKWVRRTPCVCFVAATTHDDLLEPLHPDVLIEKPLGKGITVLRRDELDGEADHG